jgi:phage terminase large subunit-like protein
MAGLVLDDWQRYVLDVSLRVRPDNRWSAFEVAMIVARQNGKGAVLEARELAGLYLDLPDEKLILHSAHEFKTCSEHFRRVLALIQGSADLDREIARIRTQTGAEAIELKNGKRLRFVARSSGSGRGFSGDLIVLDEAQRLGDEAMAALLPTLSARPDPQVWYAASAGTEDSVQLGRVRERGISGGDPALAFFEWSAGEGDDPADPGTWAKANPGLGIRITEDYVSRERAALSPDAFARERLTIGRYPQDLADAWLVIPREAWAELADPLSKAGDPVAFAVEVAQVAPYRKVASVAAAGARDDGRVHVEVVEHREGLEWVPGRLAELWRAHRPCAVVIDPSSHAGSLIEDVSKLGVEVASPFSARDAAQACGQLQNLVTARGLAHLGQPALDAALGGAVTRPLADARAWDRKSVSVDISPLVAVSLAAWGFTKFGRPRLAPYDLLKSVG